MLFKPYLTWEKWQIILHNMYPWHWYFIPTCVLEIELGIVITFHFLCFGISIKYFRKKDLEFFEELDKEEQNLPNVTIIDEFENNVNETRYIDDTY